jgi:hypothetical protein
MGMFKSRSVVEHIIRGALGFGLLTVGLIYAPVLGWWTVALLAGALLSFRGCPMCWIAGLVETVLHRKARKGCIDGSCGPKLDSSISAAPHESS